MPKTAEIFSTSLDIPVFRSSRIGRIHKLSTFNIYPIGALDQLINVIKAKESPIHTIRYLVDRGCNVWFAEEGPASASIPAHDQMRGEPSTSATCITAGNIVFSDDYLEMREFNHKSGDLRPSFDSLKWLFAVLIANQAQLPTPLALKLTIEQLSSSGGTEKKHELDKDDLIDWVTTHFDINTLQHQPTEINKVTYEAPERHRPAFFEKPFSKRLNFDDDSEHDSKDPLQSDSKASKK